MNFEVSSFEQVPAMRGTALVRIVGRWRDPVAGRLATPALVVTDGGVTHRLAALPTPGEADALAGPDPPPWRAGFAVPESLLSGGAAFALDIGHGAPIAVPRPAVTTAARAIDGALERDRAALARERARLLHLQRQHETRRAGAQRLAEQARLAREAAARHATELEQRLEDYREMLAAATEALAQANGRIEAHTGELAAALELAAAPPPGEPDRAALTELEQELAREREVSAMLRRAFRQETTARDGEVVAWHAEYEQARRRAAELADALAIRHEALDRPYDHAEEANGDPVGPLRGLIRFVHED